MHHPVTITNSLGYQLEGVLHTPPQQTTTALTCIHGFTGDKDEPILAALATATETANIATLRFDCTGNGTSPGTFAEGTITQQTHDTLAAITFLKTKGYQKIHLLGHSLGATIAAFTAEHHKVQSLIFLAPAREPGNILTLFTQKELDQAQLGQPITKKIHWHPKKITFTPDYLEHLTTHSFRTTIQTLTIPKLFLHGDHDDVVPLTDTEESYQLAKEPKRLVIIPAADHLFHTKKHQDAVITNVLNWIQTF